uniref:Uncharacterized protein n=1 Tax=Anguilla anguilla TaxID=7936 RepID=A0A0E9TCW5_ANGAN
MVLIGPDSYLCM